MFQKVVEVLRFRGFSPLSPLPVLFSCFFRAVGFPDFQGASDFLGRSMPKRPLFFLLTCSFPSFCACPFFFVSEDVSSLFFSQLGPSRFVLGYAFLCQVSPFSGLVPFLTQNLAFLFFPKPQINRFRFGRILFASLRSPRFPFPHFLKRFFLEFAGFVLL